MRTPTEKQYGTLRALGSGSAGIAWTRRQTEPLLRHGWVSAELSNGYYSWVRITAEGLRALALAVEKYGLPEMRTAFRERRVCSKCGGSRWRIETEEVERP